MDRSLHELSIAEAGHAMRMGELTSLTLTRHVLDRIEKLDGDIRAFSQLCAEAALEEAAVADAALADGHDFGPLHGIPYGSKDVIDAEGMPTLAGSRLMQSHVAAQDAAITTRLRKAGAVLLGKVQTYEFATIGPQFDLPLPPTVNPRAPAHITGGSSSGSAAAVAAGFMRFSIGSDGGGSARSPACYCGVVGLKPSYGLLPVDGMFPLSPTLDHVGILAATVEDTALCLSALAPDSQATMTLGEGARHLRIGYARSWSCNEADADVQALLDNAAEVLRALGAVVDEIVLPEYPAFERCGTTIILAEGYAVHARRDLETSAELYGRGTYANLLSGRSIRPGEFTGAQRAKDELSALMEDVMSGYDAILLANTLAPAPTVASFRDGTPRWTAMRTFPFNVTGQPALAVPMGLSADGLPLGLQFAGRIGNEGMLCRIGHAFETALNLRFPPIEDAHAPSFG